MNRKNNRSKDILTHSAFYLSYPSHSTHIHTAEGIFGTSHKHTRTAVNNCQLLIKRAPRSAFLSFFLSLHFSRSHHFPPCPLSHITLSADGLKYTRPIFASKRHQSRHRPLDHHSVNRQVRRRHPLLPQWKDWSRTAGSPTGPSWLYTHSHPTPYRHPSLFPLCWVIYLHHPFLT